MTGYDRCMLCPHRCGADRSKGKTGYCKMTDVVCAARASLHMWEEPCLSGERGAGTVFFSGCNMQCIYCQNSPISTGAGDNTGVVGKNVTVERLADIFFELEQKGAHNIDLVTPTHFMPSVRDAIIMAKNRNISIPFAYNTGGYENAGCIKELDGLIDIYLPDMKYYDEKTAVALSNAKGYFKYASEALEEMVRQTGECVFDEAGMMKKGVIVRHLVLPGHGDDSKKIIKYLYETYGDKIFISIMNQYTPMKTFENYPELNVKLSEKEYDEVVDFAIEIGVENGFIQEGDASGESFIPLFECEGI